MKRLQILIDEDLDFALHQEARAQHKSKAALIRQYVRERIKPLPPLKDDPLWEMYGDCAFEPEPIDDIVYPR